MAYINWPGTKTAIKTKAKLCGSIRKMRARGSVILSAVDIQPDLNTWRPIIAVAPSVAGFPQPRSFPPLFVRLRQVLSSTRSGPVAVDVLAGCWRFTILSRSSSTCRTPYCLDRPGFAAYTTKSAVETAGTDETHDAEVMLCLYQFSRRFFLALPLTLWAALW